MKLISPPNILLNSVYLYGLRQPLEQIAEILDGQNRHTFALAVRNACNVVDIYTEVCVDKTAKLIDHESKIQG